MGKKVITNEDFYEKFMGCLIYKNDSCGFGLNDAIVEGDIDILWIYTKIDEYNTT